MKTKFTTLLVILIAFTSCNNKSESKINKEKTSENIYVDFVKTFEGQIDNKHNIVMKLTSNSGTIYGKYFYKKIGDDIEIKGNIDDNGIIKINEFDPKGNQTGVFEGKMVNENKIDGVWSKPNGSSSMQFHLIASNSSYEITQKEIKSDKFDYISGIYQSPFNNPEISMSTTEIKYIGNNRFDFKISLASVNCTGLVEGTAKIDNNGFSNWSGSGCKSLTFKFTNRKVEIDEKDCNLHGMNCWFKGTYEK